MIFVVKVAIAVAAALLMMWFGLIVLRGLARAPEPPPPGEVRRVNLRYRCSVCAAEVKMVQATEDLPTPPRHCQEDMDLVAPPFE